MINMYIYKTFIIDSPKKLDRKFVMKRSEGMYVSSYGDIYGQVWEGCLVNKDLHNDTLKQRYKKLLIYKFYSLL